VPAEKPAMQAACTIVHRTASVDVVERAVGRAP
jgi:hypothetical protein